MTAKKKAGDRYRMFITGSDCDCRTIRDLMADDDSEARRLLDDALPDFVDAHICRGGAGKKKPTAATGRIYRMSSRVLEMDKWERVGSAAWTTVKEKA